MNNFNKNNPDSFNRQDGINALKIILLGLVVASVLTTAKVYYTHNSPDVILDHVKEKQFVKINSKIDEKKLLEFNNNDPSPFKQIFDPKISYFAKTDFLGIFIEYNIFKSQCEMTSRVMGVWGYLDLLNKNNLPLDVNIKTYKVKDDVCNRLYGYGKIN